MNLFDCLEDSMNELELRIIENLRYSENPDLSHNALLSLVLEAEIKGAESYLNLEDQEHHRKTYNFIQQLYIGRYIEQYGHEPRQFGGTK